MKSKEASLVSEDPQPTNNGIPEETPARQDVDVLLDVQELEVDRIGLKVRGLKAHVSIVVELLGSLVSLQVGVDARLDEVELEIEGVRVAAPEGPARQRACHPRACPGHGGRAPADS